MELIPFLPQKPKAVNFLFLSNKLLNFDFQNMNYKNHFKQVKRSIFIKIAKILVATSWHTRSEKNKNAGNTRVLAY
jgi:hypothetical protein